MKSTDCLGDVVGMLTRDSTCRLMSIDDLKNFLRDGEQVLFDIPEVNLLRTELRKAKQWKTRVDRLGDKLLQANDDEISELVTDAATICVDLSDSLQVHFMYPFAYIIQNNVNG